MSPAFRFVALVWATLTISIPCPARGEEPDDPKSTITEFPPRQKPAPPKPPAPPPAPALPPAEDALPPSESPAAPAPPASRAVQPTPPPSTEPHGAVKQVSVPAGQDIRRVAVPGAATQKGIGERIAEIKVVNNTKTSAVTVEYIAGVKVGMILTPELIEQARSNLLSVGLFKEVNLFWENIVPPEGLPAPGVRLVIGATDKLSWIIAPIFAYSATNYGGGVAYAESNALGHNKKFLAVGEYTTAEKLLFLAYLDPQIRDSRFYYRLDLLLRRDNMVEYASGHTGNPRVERATDLDTFGLGLLAGVNFTRRFRFDLRLKIYYDNVQASTCYNTTNQDGSGTPDVVAEQGGYCRQPSSSGWDNTLTFTIGYDGRSNVYGVLHGLQLSATYQYGASWLGTRASYHLISASGMYAWRFFKEHNLLLKLGTDVDIDPPFKQEVETGGTNMRGFIYRQYRGDTSAHATLEYLVPLFTVLGLSVRLLGFFDTNLTWFRELPPQNGPLSRFVVRDHAFRSFLPDTPSGLVRDSWHNGIGLGVRMYLKGVVLPLIGVDVAYGFESQALQVYLALGSNLD